ncbi:ribose ABC transporter, substrate-binding protein [Gluconacetobacter diazotrophicus PA1 5]|uniref:autoinducer 2 ABC transporter substrate-binding protein n=1 Tax=Gluconacetobacter diazotrophicus TaxID=33996 RepID=UPI000173BFF6|nr:autoinducer 2 ABC transporter substrate-binding protein [Gluconacetobacter diazotrophicus]ACI51950.1 ribose ABC transporter, substrate-binding protein [Gluconacetobacter diazotrophicus PA1 5]TWB05145.1 monosaccharide ABC transporter substrate-binding protein (CUT2 family) [Gluconacetobacter diazotrophicus]
MKKHSAVIAALVAAGLSCMAPAQGRAETFQIGFVPKVIGIPYFSAMQQGFLKGGRAFDARIVYQGPTTSSVAAQAQIVQSLINRKLDAVAVAANSPTALEAQAVHARERGVIFASTDSQVDGDAVDLRVMQATDEALAHTLVDQLAAQIPDGGQIAFVSGGPTATNLNMWISLMKSYLAAKFPKFQLVSVQYAGEDISKATEITSQILSAYPGLKGIIGVNTTATPGAAQAVLQAGLAGKIAITGIDDPNTIRPYVLNGTVKSAVLWNPVDLGYLTVWGLTQLLQHKPLQVQNPVPGLGTITYDPKTKTLLLGQPMVFTKENISLDF